MFVSHEVLKEGTFVGRVWRADVQGPAVITVRDKRVIDITSKSTPTVRDLLEMPNCLEMVRSTAGDDLGPFDEVCLQTPGDKSKTHFLAPCDLQVIKACGVTFAGSMVERFIEERTGGDPKQAQAIRAKLGDAIGSSLRGIEPGSAQALALKEALKKEGLWSPYLEVGIGTDAEVFTKAPILSAVGPNARVGLHPASKWNNPEPEVVLAVTSTGSVVGATLGNDVNLRDIEGRSALLLGKAKDNNASAAIGPLIRLFDASFSMDDVRDAVISLEVKGLDGFVLTGQSLMSEISRDPLDLVQQTCGAHHQYPDGFMLYLGTLFAPTQDRDAKGEGFTHKIGDTVRISSPALGCLENTVGLSTECLPWDFGLADLMRNLAARNLLN